MHRKQWEWDYILQALRQEGAVRHGARGIGFGVGREPITAWLAREGCSVLATDQPAGPSAERWLSDGQHASMLDELNGDEICPPEEFAEAVRYLSLDMRRIDVDLLEVEQAFDFAWSSCALEHLGSLAAGRRFVLESLKLLKPGGVAVHTTELNVSSTWRTVRRGHTVLYRRSDIEALAQELRRQGHELTCTFHLGDDPLDAHVDRQPWTNTHLKVALGPHIATSYGLLIRKGPVASSNDRR